MNTRKVHHIHLSAFAGRLYIVDQSKIIKVYVFILQQNIRAKHLLLRGTRAEDCVENTALIIGNLQGSSTKICNDVRIVPTLQFVSHREYPSTIPD